MEDFTNLWNMPLIAIARWWSREDGGDQNMSDREQIFLIQLVSKTKLHKDPLGPSCHQQTGNKEAKLVKSTPLQLCLIAKFSSSISWEIIKCGRENTLFNWNKNSHIWGEILY